MIEAILSNRRSHNRIILSVLMVLLYPSLLLSENIPLIKKKGGVYEVPVEVNGVITLNFILDTGASEVNIPADVALTLNRAGTIRDADFLPGQTYRLADGSTLKSSRFLLQSLKIGNNRVTNIPASVGNVSSPLLLGQSFLDKLESWGIDSQKQVLSIGNIEVREKITSSKNIGQRAKIIDNEYIKILDYEERYCFYGLCKMTEELIKSKSPLLDYRTLRVKITYKAKKEISTSHKIIIDCYARERQVAGSSLFIQNLSTEEVRQGEFECQSGADDFYFRFE